jgi:hypothetical protein
MSQTKEHKHLHEGWIRTSIIACIVAGLAIVSFWYGSMIDNIGWSIAGVGMITFFGMLAISSYHSLHNPNSTGTMRKAIASSMISVYVVVLSLLFSGNLPSLENEASMTLMENFSYVIMTIIGFYFGSKGATEFLKIWREQKNAQT